MCVCVCVRIKWYHNSKVDCALLKEQTRAGFSPKHPIMTASALLPLYSAYFNMNSLGGNKAVVYPQQGRKGVRGGGQSWCVCDTTPGPRNAPTSIRCKLFLSTHSFRPLPLDIFKYQALPDDVTDYTIKKTDYSATPKPESRGRR